MSRSLTSSKRLPQGGAWVVFVVVPIVAISTSLLTLLFAASMFGPLGR